MAEKDPWIIDGDDVKNIKDGLKSDSKGLICPKCNKSIGEKCAVCDEVSRLYNTGDPKLADIARSKKAKVNFFMNVVLSDQRDKSIILEIGRDAGNAILNGIEKQGWNDIAHPKAGKGRELIITKGTTKGSDGRDYNKYTVSPVLEKADWDIPDHILENLPNLDNIIDMIVNGELNENNYMKVSSMKMGESIRFRLCPPAKDSVLFRHLAYVWRHWGVTQDEIDGKVEMNLSTDTPAESSTEEAAPWEDDGGNTTPEPQKETPDKPISKPPCFGKENFFDPEDETCTSCEWLKKCSFAVKGN